MSSKPVAQLLVNLGIARSHSRPPEAPTVTWINEPTPEALVRSA